MAKIAASCPRRDEWSIIALDQFIQATRDSRYKGTASAISELVDNSIQAGAKQIAISLEAKAALDDEDPTIEISVLGDGSAMDLFTLGRRSASAEAHGSGIGEDSAGMEWGSRTRP